MLSAPALRHLVAPSSPVVSVAVAVATFALGLVGTPATLAAEGGEGLAHDRGHRDEHAHGGAQGHSPFSRLDTPRHWTRDRGHDLQHTRFSIEVDLAEGTVEGTSSVTMRAIGTAMTEITLDAVDMRIAKVEGPGGASLAFDYDGSTLVASLATPVPVGEDVTITVHYWARPKAGMSFVRPTRAQPDKPLEAWTQGEDEYTRHWVPCWDYPDDMGTSEALVTVKDPLKVLSNGALRGKAPAGEGKTTWHWVQDKPHVTYLFVLAIADWTIDQRDWKGLPVAFWHHPEQAANVPRTFEPTFPMLDFFSAKLGVPYPWAKYDQVVLTDYAWGGMENTSATVLTEETLHDERAHEDYASDALVAHELAHQWFGDLVTCHGWAHLWLNEGFASYMEELWFEQVDGFERMMANMMGSLEWLEGEMKRYTRPIVTHAYEAPGDMFDGHSYGKGAWVLHALRGWLNDDAVFWGGLQHYLKEHAHSTVETDELRHAFEHVSGRDLGRFFEQWLYRAGLPALTVTPTWDREGGALKLRVQQTQEVSRWVPLFQLPLDLELVLANGERVSRRFWVDTADRELSWPLSSRPVVVEVDPKGWTPGRVEVVYGRQGALDAWANGASPMTRFRALQQLEKLAGDVEVAKAIAGQATREHYFVAAEAARVLGVLNVDAARDGLLKLVGHSASRARAASVEALALYATGGDEGAADAIEGRLGDRSYRVMAAAADAWGRVAGDAAVGDLLDLLDVKAPRGVVGQAAARALSRIGGAKAERALTKATRKNTERRVREGALASLGALGARATDDKTRGRVHEVLVGALSDPEPRVRVGAVRGLQALAERRGLAPLGKVAERDTNHRVRRLAQRAQAAVNKALEARANLTGLGGRVEKLEAAKDALERRLEKLTREAEERARVERDQPGAQ